MTMQISTLNLTTDGRVSLTAYIQQPSPEMPNRAVRPAVIILPGGAYAFLSDREAEPVALAYLAAGFQAFVLRYTIGGEYAFQAALEDVSGAVELVREHAAIIAGFERHDVAYVRAAMHTHLENQIEAVRMAIREQE